MINIVTIDRLKTALTEFKNAIVSKFYNKIEVDNLLNQNKLNLETELEQKMTDYESLVDTTIQEKVDAKVFDTSGIITKTDLDPTTVITTNNLVSNNIVLKSDLDTIQYMNNADFATLMTKINS